MKRRTPFQQGDFDALCGIYAIINAIALLIPDMKDREAKRLFRLMIKTAAGKRRNFDEIIRTGMDGSLVRSLLKVAIAETSRRRVVALDLIRPRSKDLVSVKTATAFLRSNLDGRAAAILMIRDHAAHWTVATTVTERVVCLHDSSARQRLSIARCTLEGGRSKFVRIHAKECVVVKRLKPGW